MTLASQKKSFLFALAGLLVAAPASAAVTQLLVEKTTPMPGGYEMLEGHYTGALDPNDTHNAIITDLKLAPRNRARKVEYFATFAIVKPVDMGTASGLLVYDVANRGRGRPAVLGDGHVHVISGWQGDVDEGPGIQFFRAPIAPINGPTYVRFIDMPAGITTMPVKGGPQGDNEGRGFEVAAAKGARLFTLTSDATPDKQKEVPASDWSFADCSSTPFPGIPDLSKLCVKGGFDSKLGYTLAFTAKNPKILGAGFAANRDLVTFLRYDTSPANPLAGKTRWAIARGSSQSGNYLRGYINLGFNTGENGRIVFDGLNPIIAMRSISMNYRFAAPGGLVDLYELGTDAVNWWGDYNDKVRGLGRHSLLDRCRADNNCPKIAEIMGAAELRYHRGSINFVGTDASVDIRLPPNVRRYYNAGVTHGGGPGGFSLTSPPARGNSCVLPTNPNPTDFVNRAIFTALIDWVTKDHQPPPSIYPKLASGQLVSHNVYETSFPNIPGTPRPIYAPAYQYDFRHDPHFSARDLTGYLSEVPPTTINSIPMLFPRVDTDGNEIDGIRSPLLAAPLGTYVGWNVTTSGYRAGRYCFSAGGFIPFPATRAERLAKGDPRPSIEERYSNKVNYVARVKAHADALVALRYMLADDAAKMVAQAEAVPLP
jgi:hypothetical protein